MALCLASWITDNMAARRPPRGRGPPNVPMRRAAGVPMNESAAGPIDDLPLRERRRPAAPQPPQGKIGWVALYRGLRTNPITTWGRQAYEQPILADSGIMGPFVIVNRPDE